jgi:FkbM family methyltransferase
MQIYQDSLMTQQSQAGLKSIALAAIGKVTDILRQTPLRKSPLLIALQEKLLRIFHKKDTIPVGDFQVKVHSATEIIGKKLILEGGFETQEIAFLSSFVKPGDLVLDVGANIGLYSLHLSRAVGPEGRVFAFEPDPANLQLLKENIAINHCDNVTVFPVALGAEDTRQKLFTCDENKGFQSFADLVDSGTSIEVAVQRADALLEEALSGQGSGHDSGHGSSSVSGSELDNSVASAGSEMPSADDAIAIMKLDVEGAEPLVWQGMGDYKPQRLLFEFVPWQLRAVGNEPLAFLQTLVTEGYALFRMVGDRPVATLPEEMCAIAEASGLDYNLFATRVGL